MLQSCLGFLWKSVVQPDLFCDRLVERVILHLLIQFPPGSLSLFQFVVSTSVCVVSPFHSSSTIPHKYPSHSARYGSKAVSSQTPPINTSMLPGKMACLELFPPSPLTKDHRESSHFASYDFQLLLVNKRAIVITFVAAPRLRATKLEPTLTPRLSFYVKILQTYFIKNIFSALGIKLRTFVRMRIYYRNN